MKGFLTLCQQTAVDPVEGLLEFDEHCLCVGRFQWKVNKAISFIKARIVRLKS